MPPKPAAPPPAYFLSLSLENVRSFGEKQTISFTTKDGKPARWTIILGDNGVGKTTVLKSLAGLETNYIKNPGREKRDHSPIVFDFLRGKRWLPIRNGGKKTRLHYRYAVGSSLQAKEGKFLVRWADVMGVVGEESMVEAIYGDYSDYSPIDFICYGYGAGRTVGNSTLSETPEGVDTCASLFDDRADLLNPEEWFLQMEYSSLKQDKQAAKALGQVREALLKVLPDVSDLRISSKGHQQFLELLSPYGWVRLREMSLGYQTLVVWLTDFASKLFLRYPASDNPLAEPAIVLIDEIDLHLHPSWQRRLLGFLSGIFPNTQFIATAHSPLVVQAATDQDATIVLLRREGDQTVVEQNLENVHGWRVDQILSSELFDEVAPRSPKTEEALRERDTLLAKDKLTATDKKKLAELNRRLHGQDVGETTSERQAADVLRELARKLGKKSLLD